MTFDYWSTGGIFSYQYLLIILYDKLTSYISTANVWSFCLPGYLEAVSFISSDFAVIVIVMVIQPQRFICSLMFFFMIYSVTFLKLSFWRLGNFEELNVVG